MAGEWHDHPRIRFSLEQIPELREPLPVVRLGPHLMAPEALTQNFARAVAPGTQLTELGKSGLRAAFDGNRLVAYVHPATGGSRVYPALENLQPGERLARQAAATAAQILRDQALFPADMSDVVALSPVTLFGARREAGHRHLAC